MIVKTIEMTIYEPTFNVENDTFEDICPYKPRERNRMTFACRCKAGTEICNRPQYFSHINSSCHKDYIKNYTLFKKEINEEKDYNKKLKYDNEILTRKFNKKEEEENKELKELKELSSKYHKLVGESAKYHHKIQKLNDKFKNILNEMINEE